MQNFSAHPLYSGQPRIHATTNIRHIFKHGYRRQPTSDTPSNTDTCASEHQTHLKTRIQAGAVGSLILLIPAPLSGGAQPGAIVRPTHPHYIRNGSQVLLQTAVAGVSEWDRVSHQCLEVPWNGDKQPVSGTAGRQTDGERHRRQTNRQ